MGCLLGLNAGAYLSTAPRSSTPPVDPSPCVPYIGHRLHGEGSGHSGADHDGNGSAVHIMRSRVKSFRRSTSLLLRRVAEVLHCFPRLDPFRLAHRKTRGMSMVTLI